eukprot:UN07278
MVELERKCKADLIKLVMVQDQRLIHLEQQLEKRNQPKVLIFIMLIIVLIHHLNTTLMIFNRQ